MTRIARYVAMRLIMIPVLLSVASCVATPPHDRPASTPRFSAIDFFEGRTEGSGTLRIVMKTATLVRVHGRGHREGATLVLNQIVERAGMPSRTREWRMREESPGRYTGTLTDAKGAISGDAVGNQLHLSFRSKSGLDTRQSLTLAPDGRSARNIMVVRKLGLTVAVLDETIRKIG